MRGTFKATPILDAGPFKVEAKSTEFEVRPR